MTLGSQDLWQLCNRHGIVADVYIARKLSKSGHRFAFVRFFKIPDSKLLLEDLNKIWIGSYHMFASLARFDRKQFSQRPQDTQSRIPTKPTYGMKHTQHANGNRSYAIAVKIRKSIFDACLVSINNENYRVRVKEFAGWVPDFDAIDENSQKDWASNNSDSDEDEQSIHINDEKEEGEINENNKDEENVDIRVDENEEINKDRDREASNSPSKPPGFEGIQFSTSTFNHGKKRSRTNSTNSHYNVRGSLSGNRRSTGSLIDSFISHIEMGSVLGYDMEGSKTDLKKYIDSIGVHEERKKKDLWNFIRNFMSQQPGYYCVFGDFNVVRYPSEKIGSLFNHRSDSDFNEFINDCRF
ncbi:RNA-directed DNA polymerase, eukaryota [Tanacetum coccineum]